MNTSFTWDPEVSARLVFTLAHFLWQGALLGVVALLASLLLRRATPPLRYGIFLAAIFAMALCPPVTYMLLEPAALDSDAGQPGEVFSALQPDGNDGSYGTYGTNGTGAPAPTDPTDPSDPSDSLPFANAKGPEPTIAAAPPAKLAEPTAGAPTATNWRAYTPHLILVYIAGVLLMLLRLALGLAGGGRLRKRAERITDNALLVSVQRRAAQLRLRAIPVIAYCQRVAVPTVVGVIRPMILLPASLATGLPPQQVELLLLHELAHIRRYDHLINIAQRLIEAALFFHPAVWYVSHRIRVEREHCCDDLVIALGGEAYAYAESLVAAAALATGARLSPATLAATGKPSQLRRRIHRLLGDPQPPVRLVRGGWVLAILAVAAVIAGASQVANRSVSEPEREILAQAESAPEPEAVKPVAPPTVKPEPAPARPKPSAASSVEKPTSAPDPNLVIPTPEAGPVEGSPTKREQLDPATMKTIEELRVQMRDPDWWLRKVAVQQIGEMNVDGVVDVLIVSLKDEDPRVQAAAAEGLAKQGDPRAVKHLVAALKNDSEVREAAAKALTHFTPDQVMPLLTLAARDDDQKVCLGAITALGKQNTPDAARLLIELLPRALDDRPVRAVSLPSRRPVEVPPSRIQARTLRLIVGEIGVQIASAFDIMDRSIALDALQKAYGRGDWQLRTKIAMVVSESKLRGDPVIQDILLNMLKDPQKDVRAASAQVLEEFLDDRSDQGPEPPNDVVQGLIPLLRDPNRWVANLAASALSQARWQPGNPEERAWYLVAMGQSREAASLGPVAFEPLVHALQADSTPAYTYLGDTVQVPGDVIEGLAQLDDPRKVEPLITALAGADFQTTRSIAYVLGETKAPQAVDALIQLLSHVEADVRATAAEALGKIKDPRAVDPLAALLSETEPHIRDMAVVALGEIGDVRAAPALRPFLTENKGVSTATVAYALGAIRDPESAPLLAAIALDPKKGYRVDCCAALKNIGGPVALDTFLRLLGHDTDEKVRAKAAELLGALGDPTAVAALKDALFFDLGDEVRRRAIAALGHIDGPAAAEALSAGYDYAVANWHPSVVNAPAFVDALAHNADPSALDVMVRIADHARNPTLRFRVAQELAKRGDPRAIPMLQDLRNQPETRIGATNTLEQLKELGYAAAPLPDPILYDKEVSPAPPESGADEQP